MRNKLTVIIPCKDEAHQIEACVASARKVADELLVADSGSTDRTLDLVRRSGPTRIVQREYVHSGDFKNWAIPQAKHPWVLILDADERISDALANEIQQILDREPEYDGYWIYRQNYFMGHRVRFSGWQHDRVLRLFRRDLGVYRGNTDHAEVEVSSGRVSRLRNRLKHFTFGSYDEFFSRFQRYTTYQARAWHDQGRVVRRVKLLLAMPTRFLSAYILRLGFLDGLVGFQVCMLTGFYSFMKQARLWELQQTIRQRDQETSNPQSVDQGIDPRPAATKRTTAA